MKNNFTTALVSCFTLGLLGVVLFWWSQLPSGTGYNPVPLCLGIAVAVESTFFIFFVGDFLAEQIEAIDTNATLVETYQHKRGRQIGIKSKLVYKVL